MPDVIRNIEAIESQLYDLNKIIAEISILEQSSTQIMQIALKTSHAKNLISALEDLCAKSWYALDEWLDQGEDWQKLRDRLDYFFNEIDRQSQKLAPSARPSTRITAPEDRTIVSPVAVAPVRGTLFVPYEPRRFSQSSSVFRSSCEGVTSPRPSFD